MQLLQALSRAVNAPNKFELALRAYVVDLLSPETEKILGFKPVAGPLAAAELKETWFKGGYEALPLGVGYVLFEVRLTVGEEVAVQWQKDVEAVKEPADQIKRLGELLRRRYRVHPEWERHKHRFMNRVTRVVKRAEKWTAQYPTAR